jgi:hypothetical protein
MNNYPALLKEIKDRIRQAQIRATLSANAEMLFMYWEVGHIIDEQRDTEGWGAKVIQRLALDIRNELPEVKGFSERNLKRMLAFYREYKALPIGPTALAQITVFSHSQQSGPKPGIFIRPNARRFTEPVDKSAASGARPARSCWK